MKITKQNINNTAIKRSFYNNKFLLKSLKLTAEKGALVAAGTALACSSIIRPAAIMMTPDTSRDDKQYACAKSIESGLLNIGLTAAIFAPMSKVIDKISQKPDDYLKPETIKTLQQTSKTLDEAPAYNFIKQNIKMSPELIAVLPKAFITALLIVPVTKFIFSGKPKNEEKKEKSSPLKPSFTGSNSKLSNLIIGIIENKKVQEVAVEHNNTNFIQHALNLKDVYATACFSFMTAQNPKMKKEHKKSLIYNTAISTLLTMGGSYIVDKAIQKPMEKFTDNFIKANKDDPNLYKYLNGIKILKPIIILSGLYYVGIPMLSTFWAGKLAKTSDGNKVTK